MSFLFVGKKKKPLPGAITDLSFTTALPKGFVLTRSEPMLGRSPTTGRWTSMPNNIPRFDIDPVTLESRGVLVEPGRTQIVYKTRAPQYTPILATSTVDATQQTPFGLGALKLTPNTTNGFHGFDFFLESPRASAITDNTTLGIQVTLKPVGAYTRARFLILGRDNIYQAVDVSMTGNGAILSSAVVSASISRDTDGYYTVKMVKAFGLGVTTPAINMSFLTDTNARGFAADGTSHFYIAYFGAEIGNEVTTPMINDSAAIITRQPETLSATVSWIGSEQRSSFAIQYTSLSATGTVLDISGPTGHSLAIRNLSIGGSYYATSFGTPVAIINALTGTPAAGTMRTDLITCTSDEFRYCIDGVSKGIDTNGAIPIGLNKITIGSSQDGADRTPMVVKRIKYWNQNLSRYAAEMFSKNISLEGEPPKVSIITMQGERSVVPQQNSVVITLIIEGALIGSQVKYRTIDGTAKNGVEYSATSGILFLAPGQVAEQITLVLGTRPLNEDKSFIFELYDQVDATIAVTQCVITLQRVIPQGSPATNRYEFGDAFPADWLFTRASTANYRGANGLWVSAASGVPRIHYHSPSVKGLLLEPAACDQRLFDSVNQFTPVNATRALVTTEQTPTGTRQIQWRKDASALDHKWVGTFPANQCDWPTTEATLWFMARPRGHIHWKLRVKGIDNVWLEARYNFSGEGSVPAFDAAARAYIEQDNFFNEWFSFGLYRTQGTSAGVTAEFELIAVNADGTPALDGDVTQGIDICHIQVEALAGMSSPIMVQGAVAKTTRAAESLRADTAKTWYKVHPYSIAIDSVRLRDQPLVQRLVILKDQSVPVSPDDIGMRTTPNTLRALVKVQGVQQPEIVSSQLTSAGVPYTALLVTESAQVRMYHNGGLVGNDPLTVAPVIPQFLRIGSTEPSGNEQMSMVLRTVALWNYGVSDADAKLYSGNLDFVPLPNLPTVRPMLSIPTNMAVTEGNFVDVPITKSGPGACTVSFRTAAQTARFGIDYDGLGSPDPTSDRYLVVSFATGDTVKTVRVQTLTDNDLDDGRLFAILIEPTGDNSCTFGNASGVVRIEDPNVPAPGTYAKTVGYATQVDAGIGYEPYYVTSLADTNTVGTLNHALRQTNRHIVCEIGGIWKIPQAGYVITGKNLTLSGETAPKPIIVQGGDFRIGTNTGAGSNVHLRHIIIERGYDTREPTNSDGDGFKMVATGNTTSTYIENVWLDHCCVLWGNDENIGIYPYGPNGAKGYWRKISITNTIIGEPLDDPANVTNPETGLKYKGHWEGGVAEPDHAYGMIIAFGVHQVDVQHCLFQDCRMRAPWVDATTTTVIANNVGNNCGTGCHISMNNSTEYPAAAFLHTCAGYLSISGPNSPAHGGWRVITNGLRTCPAGSKAWVKGIYSEKGPQASITPWTETQLLVNTAPPGGTDTRKAFQHLTQDNCIVSTDGPKPADIPNAPISIMTAAEIYQRATTNVGPFAKRRDLGPESVRKVVDKLVRKTGTWVDHESQVGGLTSSTAYPNLTRSLRTGTPKHIDGTTNIPAYPANYATNKPAVRAWLKTFNDLVQHDPTYD